MKKTVFLSLLTLSLSLLRCTQTSKDDKNFIQAYTEVMLIQAKEEIAKTKNKIFNKQDTIKRTLEKYKLTTETYKEKLKEYTEDIKGWIMIQDSATAYLKRHLK